MLKLIFALFLTLTSTLSWAGQGSVAVASAHPLATQAGLDVLKQGGNAFDAAVAVTAALAVVEPAGSGLGGGGFWLLHRARDNFQIMIDGREMAPGSAHRDMYLDKQGQFVPEASLNGPLAAGIPGVPAALDHLSQHYGKLPLSVSLKPAIALARNGFEVAEGYQRLASFRRPVLNRYPESRDIFLADGDVPAVGHLIIQADLANTLAALAKHGKAAFYHGELAKLLVNSVRQHGGIWSLQDLANYQIKERQPIKGDYLGYRITSAALPSSGGIVMMLALNQLAEFDLANADSLQKRHWTIEAMRRAYRDRSQYLGDEDFVSIPDYLTDKDYGQRLSQTIDDHRASPLNDSRQDKKQGENTTHFSVIDSEGNRVAATLSINYPFGSGFVAEGTGVLLNDEMDDFSAQPGAANVYGLVGNEANAIAPYKRPLSSMSPTFIEGDARLMITGTPGGSRIISMVLLSLLDFVDGQNAAAIVSRPRYHHQYLPDEVQVENSGFSETELLDLKNRGHKVNRLTRQYGDMQTVIVNKQTGHIDAASDPRGEGQAKIMTLVKD